MMSILSVPQIGKILVIACLFIAITVIAVTVTRKFKWSVSLYFGGCLLGWFLFWLFDFGHILIMSVAQIISWIMYYFAMPKEQTGEVAQKFRVALPSTTGRKYYIENINRGVAIFGASGSGKSQSVIRAILKHYAKHQFSGIIHDYKDFELTEDAGTIFSDQGIEFSIFAIHRPQNSIRTNVLAPHYIADENKLRGLVSNLILNLKGAATGDTFWRSAAEGVLVGMIWRMKKDFPDLCNLPFVVAMLLQVKALHQEGAPFANLIAFLSEDNETAMKAGSFMAGTETPKLLSSVFSTLTDCLQLLDSPAIFYLLSKDEYDLSTITTTDQPQVLSIVNLPGVDAASQSPINAMIIDLAMNLINRNSRESFILIDEASTIKIDKLEQRVATLRSFNASFVYAMQDMIQGLAQWGGKEYFVKSILTNLSTLFCGKINDATTGEYYEKFFEMTERSQYSYSRGGMFSGSDDRVTKSFKEQRKIRGFEFQRLKPGEFVMLSDGFDKRFRFAYEKLDRYDYKSHIVNACTPESIRHYSTELIKLAYIFINQGYKDRAVTQKIINQFKALNA